MSESGVPKWRWFWLGSAFGCLLEYVWLILRGRITFLIAFLLLCSVAQAQSYSFTVYDDPSLCTLTNCATWVGSGSFTVGSTPTVYVKTNLYPITSLSGTLNGQPLSLFSNASGNLFYTLAEPIFPNQPLYLASGDSKWNIQMTDFNHPGTGQTMYDYQGQKFTPVSFAVQPAASKLLTSPPAGGPRVAGTFTVPVAQPASPFRGNHNLAIGIDVGAAAGVVFALVEYERHRHREAIPAGELR